MSCAYIMMNETVLLYQNKETVCLSFALLATVHACLYILGWTR